MLASNYLKDFLEKTEFRKKFNQTPLVILEFVPKSKKLCSHRSSHIQVRQSESTNFLLFYGVHQGSFGECFIALATKEKGKELWICFVSILEVKWQEKNRSSRKNTFFLDTYQRSLNDLQKIWPEAELIFSQKKVLPYAKKIFAFMEGKTKWKPKILLRSSIFQKRVWQSLACLKRKHIISYSDLACQTGNPKAIRATASAVASNPVSLLIPCHRVISKKGKIHQYRWGKEKKLFLLQKELRLR